MNGPQLERLLAVAASPSARAFAVGGRRDLKDAPEALGGAERRVFAFAIGKSIKPSFEASVGETDVLALAYLADDALLVGTRDGRVLRFDPTKDAATPSHTWQGEAAVHALAVNGKRVAVVDAAGHAHLLDGALGNVASRQLAEGALFAVRFAGERLVVGGADGVARALPATLEGDVREMPLATEAVTALAITDDARAVAGLADGRVMIAFLEGAVDAEDRSAGAPHDTAVRGLVVVPEQRDEQDRPLARRLLSLSEDGALKSWELDSRRRPKTVSTERGARGLALVAPSRKASDAAKAGTLVVAHEERTVTLQNLDAGGKASDFATVLSRFSQLAQDVRARSDDARRAAIAELGRLPEDDARKLLEQALGQDRQATLRGLAASTLGEGMRRLSRPALRGALNDADPKAREAAFAALRKIDEASPLSPVRAALGSSYADIRMDAVFRLPALRAVSPLVPGLVADALNDSDATVREAAFEALFSLSDEGSLDPIVVAMRHGPDDVRQLAVLRLARSGADSDVGRDLLERALDDGAEEVRRAALYVAVGTRPALAAQLSLMDERARKELARVARRAKIDPPPPLDAPAAALTDVVKQPLFAALAARSSDSALRGARALGLLGDPRASGALLSLSREPDPSLRRAVVEALEVSTYAMPQDARLVARLEWLLDDPDDQVRAVAFDALRRLKKPEGGAGELSIAALALRCKAPDVRVRALPVLVAFGGGGKYARDAELAREADRLLGDALDDEGERVRAEAFRTLWSWHAKAPREPLGRAARSRHPDIRQRVATELGRIKEDWADELLLELVGDSSSSVGRAAFDAFHDKSKGHAKQARLYLAALGSSRSDMRTLGCRRAPAGVRDDVLPTIVKLVSGEEAAVAVVAIEAVDRLKPDDLTAFQQAFASVFFGLRVRAGELCGKRRDERAIEPMQKLLSIPQEDLRYPSQELRRRAAAALADVGAPSTLSYLAGLLEEEDGFVAEQAARGLATAVRPGEERPLVDALSHANLAVRSWVAEGLARLGDVRAIPVLAGSLAHDHRPNRFGAIMGYVALGPDGVRGILAGLDDHDPEIAELCFAVTVARDLVLQREGLAPDLLLSVLGSGQPELRFAAARLLEVREDAAAVREVATGLVGPPLPERAKELEEWPAEDKRAALLQVIVDALGSDHPAQRYAATQVLALRRKPNAFWREAARMSGPALSANLRVPHTNWEKEPRQPTRRGWIRALFSRPAREPAEPGTGRVLELLSFVGGATAREVPRAEERFEEQRRLAFGTYVGLVRQAPREGDADQTHRVRRDSIGRLASLAEAKDVGRDVVLPVLRQSLNDPNHLVRRAAIAGLRGLYDEGSVVPLSLMLGSSAADVGRAAVDAALSAAQQGNADGEKLVRAAIDAPVSDVRKHALSVLPRLFESGSAEPFILALGSTHADVRLAVVDRLVDSTDERVKGALSRAMESTHEDLRLKAAAALARRGDETTVDVLAGLLRSERGAMVRGALEALVALAHAGGDDAPAKAAAAVAQRLGDDPDRTADRAGLMNALGRIAAPEAAPTLLAFTDDEDPGTRDRALGALLTIATDRATPRVRLDDGRVRARYHEAKLVEWLGPISRSTHEPLRLRVARVLGDVDDRGAEAILSELLSDRSEVVRAQVCETLAFRVEHVEGASLEPLATTLRGGRREMVLPAALGLASRQRPEAFQALLLVLKAGLQPERERAVLGLGSLGDVRGLEELAPLLDPTAELEPDDVALRPAIARSYGRFLRHLPEDAAERPVVRETLERLATETVGAIRLSAMTGLREAADERSRALLERVAADGLEAPQIRQHAIRELAILGDESSEHGLAEMLNDARVSRPAMEALERIFPTDRTRTSLHALRSHDRGLQAKGAGYLTRHGETDTLVQSLPGIDDPGVRATLRRGLVRRGACPPEPLRVLLAAERPGPREDAAWIAGAKPDAAASLKDDVRRAIDATLAQRDARQRAEADRSLRALLWAATSLALDAAEPARAVLAATDAAPAARREAARHLAARGDTERMKASAFDRDAAVRATAGEALGAKGAALLEAPVVDGAAVTPVIAAVRASDEAALYTDARRRQLALPTVFRGRDAPQLLALATDGGDRQLAAIDALGRLGGEAAKGALQGLVDGGPSEDVKKAAFKSLRRLQRRAARLDAGHAS